MTDANIASVVAWLVALLQNFVLLRARRQQPGHTKGLS